VVRALLFVVVILLAGCPRIVRPTFPHTDANVLLRAHDSMRARVTSLRAEARVDQRGHQGRIRGTVLMFVEKPDRVRFDAMTQFGPAAILTSDGATFSLTDLRERRFMIGPTCPNNIARLLGIPLSGEDVGRMLLGGAPRMPNAGVSLAMSDEGYYRVTLHAHDGTRQELDYTIRESDANAPPAEQRLRLIRAEAYDAQDATIWRAIYRDYRVIPLGEMGVAMPYEVHFFDPRHATDVLIHFESIDLNVQVPEGAFTQEPPPAVSIEEVSCE
jgi:hypothetical protein